MKEIKRYLVKINKYVVGADSSEMISLGYHTVETEGGSICHLPSMGAFKSDSKFCFTLEVLEERIYKQSTTGGMIELVDTIVLKKETQ